MNILLTNGDGYKASGLAAMRRALMTAGFNVLTVAPAEACSQLSRSRTHAPISFGQIDDDARHPIFKVDGSPADCVRIAILSGLAREASLVISGISESATLGDDTTYSSTFGAAAEAAFFGYPAMAVSQQISDRKNGVGKAGEFEWCGVVAAELAAWMMATPPPERSVLNVNAPTSLSDRHIKLTTFDQRIWDPANYSTTVAEDGSNRMTFAIRDQATQFEMLPNSDALALANGHVSITPVSLKFQHGDGVRRLNSWLTATIAGINPRIGASSGRCLEGCCG